MHEDPVHTDVLWCQLPSPQLETLSWLFRKTAELWDERSMHLCPDQPKLGSETWRQEIYSSSMKCIKIIQRKRFIKSKWTGLEIPSSEPNQDPAKHQVSKRCQWPVEGVQLTWTLIWATCLPENRRDGIHGCTVPEWLLFRVSHLCIESWEEAKHLSVSKPQKHPKNVQLPLKSQEEEIKTAHTNWSCNIGKFWVAWAQNHLYLLMMTIQK